MPYYLRTKDNKTILDCEVMKTEPASRPVSKI
jgi:hypothetical protein